MAKAKSVNEVLDKYAGKPTTPLVPTDSLSLDKLFGGGFPLGKYVQLYSPPGIGKTTVAVWIAVALAERGYKTLFLDVENALEDSLVVGCGGEKHLESGMIRVIRQAYTFEHLQEVVDSVLRAAEHSMLVLDSITAVLPSKLLEVSVEDVQPGLKARLEGAFLQKFKAAFRENECSLMLLNQMRTKLNFRRGSSLGASGSNALHFFSDVTISMRRAQFIVEGGQRVGSTVTAVAEKNKRVAPYFEYPLHVVFGRGISNLRTLVSIMEDNDLIERSGAYYLPWCAPDGAKKLLGNERLFDWVRENAELVESSLREEGYI